jgi:uncharacterized protein (TIGR02421 family)
VIATALAPSDLAVDHALAQVAESYRFLLDVTPIRDPAERRRFLDGEVDEPRFAYRDLEVDPDVLAEQLAACDLDSVGDPTLAQLLRAKHREVELQVEMLRARCTSEFLTLSIDLYGAVEAPLLETAESIIAHLPEDLPPGGPPLDADRFVALAEAELDHYRAIDPDCGLHVEIRPDAIGILVAGGTLLVSPSATVASLRADALVQHEVGTHLLTHVNGAYQPVRVLATGLAGYEETQEGLGVLAEIVTAGLPPSRLRQLAARVIAVDRVVRGAGFADVYRELVELGLSPTGAYNATVRCVRAGGLTKDAIYLRGLIGLLDHLADGGDLDLLLLGKLSLDDLPLVADLVERSVLVAPRLRPRYLDGPDARRRLDRLRATTDLIQLTGRAT